MKLIAKLAPYLPTVLFGLVVSGGVAIGVIEPPPKIAPPEIDSIQKFFDLFKTLIGWLLAFAILIGVVAIIFGGITYVTAGGNSERAGTAAKVVGYALLGIAIMVLAFALVNIIASLVGANTTPVTSGLTN